MTSKFIRSDFAGFGANCAGILSRAVGVLTLWVLLGAASMGANGATLSGAEGVMASGFVADTETAAGAGDRVRVHPERPIPRGANCAFGACGAPLAPSPNVSFAFPNREPATFGVLAQNSSKDVEAKSARTEALRYFADASGILHETSATAFAAAGEEGAWIVNDTGIRSRHISEFSGGPGVFVNVQSVTSVIARGEQFTFVEASGVPDYVITLTQIDIDGLNARPTASTDFVGGMTSASAGVPIAFGQNIGYNSSANNCPTTGGSGYWPPGPACPLDSRHRGFFPDNPQPAPAKCDTGLGTQGLWVNGTSIFNWDDGQSYKNENVWRNLAPVAEQFDVDICGGHATERGDYHHHFHSKCLADLIGDEGNDHSPVYGYAADGYALYGPWESAGQLAISSWKVRDYTAASATGCGAAGARTCILVNQLDASQGTVAASAGPTTSEIITTQSNKFIVAAAGFYFEDHYWDSTLSALGNPYLDRFNGHSDATRGYHYHVTVTSDGSTLTPYFPYTVGPQFYGRLNDNALLACESSSFNARIIVPAVELLFYDN